jgi:hypothetical protein
MKSRWLHLFAGILLLGGLCHAGVVSSSYVLTGSAGDVLTFQADLTNDWGYDAYLASISVTLAGFTYSDEDLTPFLLYAPLTLASGSSTGTFDWFTVTVPTALATGSYSGTVVLLGGATVDSQEVLDSAGFTVANVSTAPEPASVGLLAGGILLFVAKRFHRVEP